MRNRKTLILSDQYEKAFIARASRDLARGTKTAKVNKWITYMSVPLNTLSPILSTSLGLLGAIATFVDDHYIKRNNWLNVVR